MTTRSMRNKSIRALERVNSRSLPIPVIGQLDDVFGECCHGRIIALNPAHVTFSRPPDRPVPLQPYPGAARPSGPVPTRCLVQVQSPATWPAICLNNCCDLPHRLKRIHTTPSQVLQHRVARIAHLCSLYTAQPGGIRGTVSSRKTALQHPGQAYPLCQRQRVRGVAPWSPKRVTTIGATRPPRHRVRAAALPPQKQLGHLLFCSVQGIPCPLDLHTVVRGPNQLYGQTPRNTFACSFG